MEIKDNNINKKLEQSELVDSTNEKKTAKKDNITQQAAENKDYDSVLNSSLCDEFFNKFENYKEQSIQTQRFKYNDVQTLIKRLSRITDFKIKNLGKSVEGRNINQIKIGKGKVKVLLWSQMHGDEPTGTAAIFDVLNFFQKEDEYSELKKQLLNNLSIYFVPMVNPDGAEVFSRRNALDIDLNRDAITQTAPESKILTKVRADLLPDFGFNLHDHNQHYRVDGTTNSAIISLLAPAFDEAENINPIRVNSIKLVVGLNNLLEKYIPGHIARFRSTFDARCFGDQFQKAGTSTILIEAGNILDDPEKQLVRKFNFLLILCSLISIAEGSYEQEDIKKYDKIPFVKQDYFDLIIRNAQIKGEGKLFNVDIGIDRDEVTILDGKNDKNYIKSKIRDLGDLAAYGAYEEFDASGYEVEAGRIFPQVLNSIRSLKKLNFETFVDLLKMGYTTLKLKKLPYGVDFSRLPINLVAGNKEINNAVKLNNKANFILKKHGLVVAVIVNGFFYALEE